jgi:hypothetical protein
MAQWYYQLLGEEFGPVSEASLRQLLIDGTLCNSDLVRGETSADWIPLSDASIDAATDRVTDMSELNFQFEESSAKANSTPAKNRAGSAVADRPPGPSQYYYQFFGQTLGPIPLDTLIRMAEAGRLTETDLVRAEEDFLWQAAGEFSELSAAFLLRMPEKPAPPTAAPPEPPATPVSSTAAASTALPPTPLKAAAATAAPIVQPPPAAPPAAAAKPGRGRGRKKDRKAEEKLVDNILSEVFADDEDDSDAETGSGDSTNSRTASAEQPLARSVAAPTTASSPSSTPATAAAAGPRAWGSVGSSPQASTTAAAAAAAKPVLRATPKSKSSSSGPWLPNIQLDFNGPVKALLGLGLIAALWFGYTPLMRYFKTDEARYISRMELAIETCEKLNPMTEEAKFKGQQEAMKREFGAYVALMTEAGSTRESAKNCLGALNRMLEFSRVDPINSTLQKKLLDEAKLLIKKYKGV